MRKIVQALYLSGLLGSPILSSLANSLEIDHSRYDVYYGDINGDGWKDFYFHEVPIFIILHGDVPIVLPIFNSVSFAIFYDGSEYSQSEPSQLSREDISTRTQNSSLKKLALNSDFLLWTNPNSPEIHLLLRGLDDRPSLVLSYNYEHVIPIVVGSVPVHTAANLNDRSKPVSLADVNRDARSDIVVGQYAYLVDFGGAPLETPIMTTQSGPITENFVYDGLGRLIEAGSTDGRVSRFQYDTEDNRTQSDEIKGI